MSERLDIGFSIPAEDGRPKPKPGRLLGLSKIIDWIKLLELDESTTNGLIEAASQFPEHALPNFRKNINVFINRVRRKAKQVAYNKLNKESHESSSLDENSETS